MGVPNIIANGQIPDGTKLKENFDYLYNLISGGQAIKTGTLENIKATALANPTIPFLAIPNDLRALLLYTGIANAGPEGNGFVTLASWEIIS